MIRVKGNEVTIRTEVYFRAYMDKIFVRHTEVNFRVNNHIYLFGCPHGTSGFRANSARKF